MEGQNKGIRITKKDLAGWNFYLDIVTTLREIEIQRKWDIGMREEEKLYWATYLKKKPFISEQ